MKTITTIAFTTLVLLGCIPLQAQQPAYTLDTKLSPSDGSANDNFGGRVHQYKNKLIVGASRHDISVNGVNTPDVGAAYIYERDAGGIWIEQKLSAWDGDTLDLFGSAVSISDSFAVVGATWQDYHVNDFTQYNNIGAAYVFRKDIASGNWTPWQKLSPDLSFGTNGDEWFGNSVSISGLVIAVGAPYADIDTAGVPVQDAGAAYVFEWDAAQNKFAFKTMLLETVRNVGDAFGTAVQVDGVDIVVGAPGNDYDESETNMLADAGAAYVYEQSAPGQWMLKSKLAIPASNRETNAYFGIAVAVNAGNMVISAPFHDSFNFQNLTDQGLARHYFKSLGTWNSTGFPWVCPIGQQEANSNFGSSLALWGNQLIAGSPYSDGGTPGSDYGTAYLFNGGGSSGNYQLQANTLGYSVSPNANDDRLGESVGMYGRRFCVGSQRYDIDGAGNTQTNIGAVFVFCAPLTFSSQPADDTVCLGGSTQMQVSTYFADSHQWYLSPNGGTTWTALSNSSFYSGVTTPTLTIQNPLLSMDSYMYRCEIVNECAVFPLQSNAATLTVSACVGIQTASNTSQPIRLYPNPNNGAFTLEYISAVDFEISDLTGKIAHSGHANAGRNELNMQWLTNGMYVLKCTTPEGVSYYKIIKE
jgi:hypothetical protein